MSPDTVTRRPARPARRKKQQPVSTIRIPRELAAFVAIVARRNHRSTAAEVTHGLEQYLLSIGADQLINTPTLTEILKGEDSQ